MIDEHTTARKHPAESNTDVLLDAIERLNKGDYLQQKGVGKDWYCVINPATEHVIKSVGKRFVQVPAYVHPLFELDYIMGRRVLITSRAPMNIEYMDEATARLRYPECFEKRGEAEDQEGAGE
jgi:hypothetical protein